MYLFVARGLTFVEATPEDDEQIQVELVPLKDALGKIESGEIVDAKSIVGLLRVWRRVNK